MIVWAPLILAAVKDDNPEADTPHGRYPQILQLVNERLQLLRRGRFKELWQLAISQTPRAQPPKGRGNRGGDQRSGRKGGRRAPAAPPPNPGAPGHVGGGVAGGGIGDRRGMNYKDVKESQQWETGDPAMGQLLIEMCRQVRLGERARAREPLGDAALANITRTVWERIGNLLITKTWRVEGEEPQNPSDTQLT